MFSDYYTLLLDDDLRKVVNDVNRGKFGDAGGINVVDSEVFGIAISDAMKDTQGEEKKEINLPVF